ncbi:hypothetical protein [Variovorax sp.]|jgi:hypothetical protein|uniref:hypothetical protein n=1 Tax=Variovorax sp. TaxID=1871043 RepID=UPI00120C85D1|nr:hypothetical protein [Variovorax sp.]TAJ58998.1 MAG: hypothetical protein EPO53_32725 [Variovorax sp.]
MAAGQHRIFWDEAESQKNFNALFMSRRLWSVLALFVVALGITAYFSFLAGASRALAVNAVVNSVSIKAEERCYKTNDLECFRASWILRAGVTAMSAHRSLEGFYPAAAEPELRSYIQWAEQLPKIHTPEK